MAIKEFRFEGNAGGKPVLVVTADDGLEVVFWPHLRYVGRPKLAYVALRDFWSRTQLARYNVHDDTGGGRFTLVAGDQQHACELGKQWVSAYHFLDPANMEPTLRLGITSDQLEAWDYVNGSLVWAQRLQNGHR
jgi:hypothetical protein